MLRADLDRSQQQQWDALRELVASYAVRRPVRKVAVVGNAPLEPDGQRVDELDSSDLVLRANSMALDEPGGPPCVGTTCHVVLLSRSTRLTPWVFRDYRRRAYLVPQMGFPLYYTVRPGPAFWPADLGAVSLPNGVVKRRLADLLDPAHEPGRLTPTTGITAVYLAHEMFPDADLVATGFSFVADQDQREWAHHAGGTTAVNKYHDLRLESALLRRWIADGSLRFFA